jgi:uncharacterized protein (TIGR00369 family)
MCTIHTPFTKHTFAVRLSPLLTCGFGDRLMVSLVSLNTLRPMSPAFQPRDPNFDERVRESFARQGLLATFAAELRSVEPGAVDIEVPFAPGLTQQDDFFHAGVAIAALDSACGYAALTLMTPGMRVLTVELKVNLLAPAVGDSLQAHGEVIRPGRNLTICRGDAYAVSGDGSKHVATILTTMTGVPEPEDQIGAAASRATLR